MEREYERVVASDADWVGEGQRLGTEALADFLARSPRVAVAFSGGCDSAYLLAAARAAGCEVRAYLVDTAFQPAFERADALSVASALDVPLTVIEADVLARREICENSPDRCYACKRFIFETIQERVREDARLGLWESAMQAGRSGASDATGVASGNLEPEIALPVLVDGTNASDDPARRPGFRALAETGVVSPLRRAGLSKAQVREASAALAARLGISPDMLRASKPSFPCLAVFVPQGEPITLTSLAEAARSRGL